ncbi:MAG: hypothetical protein WBK55_09835 [Alphaproteobacteria bacterium]
MTKIYTGQQIADAVFRRGEFMLTNPGCLALCNGFDNLRAIGFDEQQIENLEQTLLICAMTVYAKEHGTLSKKNGEQQIEKVPDFVLDKTKRSGFRATNENVFTRYEDQDFLDTPIFKNDLYDMYAQTLIGDSRKFGYAPTVELTQPQASAPVRTSRKYKPDYDLTRYAMLTL